MDSPSQPGPEQVSETPPLTDIGVYRTRRRAREHGLVILSMQIPYWLDPEEDGVHLLVETRYLDAVRHQIAKYDRENRHWPPRPPPEPPPRRVKPLSFILFFGFVCTAFWVQTVEPGRLESIGALQTNRVFAAGQWWRPVTSLFLHANIAHLAGNVGIGACFFYFACRTFGSGPAWFLTLLAAALGNFLSAALHHGDLYESIGASTAVFAALGLLTGAAAVQRLRFVRLVGSRSGLAALAAGLVLLGMLGVGSNRVDVVAHACGFGSGLLFGVLAAWARGRNFILRHRYLEPLLGIATLATIVVAWTAAFASAPH